MTPHPTKHTEAPDLHRRTPSTTRRNLSARIWGAVRRARGRSLRAPEDPAFPRPSRAHDPALAEARERKLRWAWALLGAITVLHLLLGAQGAGLRHAGHVVLAGLYLAPIVLAAKARGARAGALFAGAASLLYLGHVALRDPAPWASLLDELAVVAGFVTVGLLVGSLTTDSESRRDERDRVLLAAARSEVRSALDALVTALGARDPALAEHSRRVADLAELVAHALDLDRSQRAAAHLGGLLHDVGKIGLGDDVLHSAQQLSLEQRARIRDHPRIAADLVRSVGGDEDLAETVLSHHESPDGSGYPRGLRGPEIPLLARALKVADIFVAITEARRYRPAATPEAALEELRAMAPDRVDPTALAALESVVAKGWWPPGHLGGHNEISAATTSLAIVGEREETMKPDERSHSDSAQGRRAGSAWLMLIAVAAWGVRPGTAAAMELGSPAIAAPASGSEPANALLASEAATIDLFEAASRSVVCIRTFSRHVGESAGAVHELPLGAGSGFVWDRQGHIVTNVHVVDGAEQVEVALADRSHWRARLVGIAPEKDLAVLRIDAPAEQLEPLPVADSTLVRVGQTVLAVGNPFGFDHTLTTGIGSALGRTIDSPSGVRIHGMIQTDAAINPGSSGGPLIDSRGRLVGVNTAIYGTSGSSAGVGFAIPAAAVARSVPQLVRHGRIVRPSLGFELAPDALADALGLAGALVLTVDEGSEAARLGVTGTQRKTPGGWLAGDLVEAVDGRAIRSSGELLDWLESKQAGETVTLDLYRGGERRTLSLVLAPPGPGPGTSVPMPAEAPPPAADN